MSRFEHGVQFEKIYKIPNVEAGIGLGDFLVDERRDSVFEELARLSSAFVACYKRFVVY